MIGRHKQKYIRHSVVKKFEVTIIKIRAGWFGKKILLPYDSRLVFFFSVMEQGFINSILKMNV